MSLRDGSACELMQSQNASVDDGFDEHAINSAMGRTVEPEKRNRTRRE